MSRDITLTITAPVCGCLIHARLIRVGHTHVLHTDRFTLHCAADTTVIDAIDALRAAHTVTAHPGMGATHGERA